jgi:hypothetical protein
MWGYVVMGVLLVCLIYGAYRVIKSPAVVKTTNTMGTSTTAGAASGSGESSGKKD